MSQSKYTPIIFFLMIIFLFPVGAQAVPPFIQDLIDEIDTLKADIAVLQAQNTAQQGQIDTQAGFITVIQTEQTIQNGDISTLQAASVPNLSTYLRVDETDPQRPTVWFEAVNVQVVNGLGSTGTPDVPITPNGLGNLIVGYDEVREFGSTDKSGSHNLVVGPQHNYSSYGGLIAGFRNTVSGPNSSVIGGTGGTASGDLSSVSGGRANTASGPESSVSGGSGNNASALFSSVSGGNNNTASGTSSSISGGAQNNASALTSSVSGGVANTASGNQSSVSGGVNRSAPGQFNWAAGELTQIQ